MPNRIEHMLWNVLLSYCGIFPKGQPFIDGFKLISNQIASHTKLYSIHMNLDQLHESVSISIQHVFALARSLSLSLLSPRRPALILICYWDISFINSNDQYRLQKIENIPIKTALKPIPPRIFLLYKMDREREWNQKKSSRIFDLFFIHSSECCAMCNLASFQEYQIDGIMVVIIRQPQQY